VGEQATNTPSHRTKKIRAEREEVKKAEKDSTKGRRKDTRTLHTARSEVLTAVNIGCFKKSFTTLKEYIHLFRGHVQWFEMS
jgi:hypothetical protein